MEICDSWNPINFQTNQWKCMISGIPDGWSWLEIVCKEQMAILTEFSEFSRFWWNGGYGTPGVPYPPWPGSWRIWNSRSSISSISSKSWKLWKFCQNCHLLLAHYLQPWPTIRDPRNHTFPLICLEIYGIPGITYFHRFSNNSMGNLAAHQQI